MAENQDFLTELSEMIAQRKTWFESTELPRLRKCFQEELASLSQLLEWLVHRNYLQKDPYIDEMIIDGLEPIPDAVITPTNFAEELGTRLSELCKMVDFIVTTITFSLDILTPSLIQKMRITNAGFLWDELGNAFANQNTKALSALINVIRQKEDNLTLSLVYKETETLAALATQQNMIFESILDFHKENYKCIVRRALSSLSGYSPEAASVSAGYEDIKSIFQKQVVKLPFNNAAILEIVEENLSADSEERKAALLKKLKIVESNKKKVVQIQPREYLMAAVDVMGGFGAQIDSIAKKVALNSSILNEQNQNLFVHLLNFLKELFGWKDPPQEYKVEIKSDNNDSYSRTETVILDELQDYLRTKSRFFTEFSDKESNSYKSLSSFSDAQLDEFIESTMSDVRHHIKILMALDAYFKDSAVGENKHKIRGFKVESTTLVSMVFKVEKCRSDYSGGSKK